jgi:stress-induced morphogen
MTQQQMLERLKSVYPNSEIDVIDTTGGGDHWQVSVVSPLFKGLSRVEQHQHVMSAFSEELKTGEVHALAIKTKIL